MRAAGLHPVATLLESQAVLIRSRRPSPPEHAELVERIVSRIAGVVAAGKYVLCNYNIRRSDVPEAVKITPGRRAATVSPLDDGEWAAVGAMVLKSELASVMDRLQAAGATDILVTALVRWGNMRAPLTPADQLPSLTALDAHARLDLSRHARCVRVQCGRRGSTEGEARLRCRGSRTRTAAGASWSALAR